MNVVVLTKWVPEPEGTPTLGADGLLVREGADGALDPGDEYGLEAALQLVEAADDGEITLLTMGPEVAQAALQRGLAMGAHRGVRITDDALRGADSLVTARVLAAAIGRQEFDLVIGGVESTDGYTGIVPAAIAELLGLPSLTFARKLDTSDGALRIERQTVAGYDVVTAPLPAVVTVTAGATEPRYPSLKGVMAAKSKPVETIGLSELGLSSEDATATQSVAEVTDAPPKQGGETVEFDETTPARMADLLAEAKVI
ncbi:MAG: electron transfer flavoprotein subunit beta/FixA family protein [Actinomycetota bacterium]